MHATWQMGESLIGAADVVPESYRTPQGFALSVSLSDAAEAERLFGHLAENGTVHMPVQETFWALRFGVVVDQFGTPWQINCEKPA